MADLKSNSCPIETTYDRIHTVYRDQPEYPHMLNRLAKPPPVLYIKGHIPLDPMIAVVGSRNVDSRMRKFAFTLSTELTARGFVIISGGAFGIDTAAHEGALQQNGKTVAVIGSGFDFFYPQKNKKLFQKIIFNGAVISEFLPHTPPSKWTFPKRNRLIASLAESVVVISASERSGALITANYAKAMDIPVGAVPAAPNEVNGRGCNRLLREGAFWVENVEDILNMSYFSPLKKQLNLPGTDKQVMQTSEKVPTGLSQEENEIWERLASGPMHIDEIALNLGLSLQTVMTALLNMELSGLIEDLGGKNYIRV